MKKEIELRRILSERAYLEKRRPQMISPDKQGSRFLSPLKARKNISPHSSKELTLPKTPPIHNFPIFEANKQFDENAVLDEDSDDVIMKALSAAAKAASAAATARTAVQSKILPKMDPEMDSNSAKKTDQTSDSDEEQTTEARETWRTTPNRIAELCSTMRENTTSANVQQWVGLAMDEFDWDEAACERFIVGGGVEGLVAGMQAHAALPDVQRSLCSALATIATVPDARRHAAKAGAAERLFAAMGTHSARADVLEAALRALLTLLWDATIRGWIRTGGGIAAVLRAMAAHPAHAGVQEWGARALGCFAADRAPRGRLGAAGGVDALLDALGPLRADAAGRNAAVWALTAAALHRDNQTRILSSPPPRLRLLAEALSQQTSSR
jgi:hypothetical protein